MVYSACLFVFYNVYLSQVDLNVALNFYQRLYNIYGQYITLSKCMYNHQAQIKGDWLKMSFLHILFDVQCFTVVCYLQNF